jgi:hypothetical protein
MCLWWIGADGNGGDKLGEMTTASQGDLVTRRHNQSLTFNRLVVAAITLIVGVLVFNQVLDSLPSTSGGINRTNIVGTIESAMVLAPVVLIVLVAALILAQVTDFGR